MVRVAVGTFIAFMIFSASSHAAWFVRLDSANRLVVTGIATDNEGVSSTVTLTCTEGPFAVEILTRSNVQKDDLPSYSGTQVTIAYQVKGGEVKKLQLTGVPVVVAGGVLGIVSDLSMEQSKAVFTSIGRGYPLELEIMHPELLHDVGKKLITKENFPQAQIAISDHCQGFQ
jgi:hypothetical protein